MDRLPKEESQTLEFKKTLAEMREIVETVCAFANTRAVGFLSVLTTLGGCLVSSWEEID
jgi:predicted HTH transcriptional regulator